LRVLRRRCLGYRYTGTAVSSNPAGGGNFEFTYGYIEFRAILPAENGIWTALWTNGQNWPADGEIDVMESGLPSASTQAWNYQRSSGVTGEGLPIPGASTRWHTYAAFWEPGRIRWYFDGNLVGTETSGVVGVPHYLALTATDWRPANPSGPATTRVDYVRVWQRDDGPVTTAAARVSDETLVVRAAPGVSDNLQITRSSDDTLRVSNDPSAPYAGGSIDAAGGCTPSGDQAVECRAVHVRRIRVTAGDKPDRVKNLTGLRSTVYGEGGKDLLIGGRNDDNLFGGPAADVLRGMDGNDFLHARDLGSEEGINCDGGSSPGDQDQADLDSWPQDPNPRGCELRTRR
jgi:Ca2+-binding RTX toxin-like protein